jgi:folate-binding protein YgfZ
MSLLDQYHALRYGAGLIDRSHRGRLLLNGADRRDYLQGLLTNDISALTPGSGCYAAYLTPQGRMIADMRVFETGAALLVDLDGRTAPAVRDRWERFIFAEDVRVSDMSPSTAQLGVYGPRAAEVIEAALKAGFLQGGSVPPHGFDAMPLYANLQWDLRGGPAFLLRSDDAGVAGFDIVIPSALKDEVARGVAGAGGVDVGPEAAEICRVEAGRPLFHADMNEETIPLEAGIEGRAISLTKGCYVGQEIIVRVLHRGHGRVARRLVGVVLEQSAPVPATGEPLHSGDRDVGSITSAVASIALGRPIALAYVHRDFVEPGTALTAAGGQAIVSALPFV